jgi:hypothetical protein
VWHWSVGKSWPNPVSLFSLMSRSWHTAESYTDFLQPQGWFHYELRTKNFVLQLQAFTLRNIASVQVRRNEKLKLLMLPSAQFSCKWKAVLSSKSFHFHYSAFNLLGFCTAFFHIIPLLHDDNTSSPSIHLPLHYKVSHPAKTVVTTTVPWV